MRLKMLCLYQRIKTLGRLQENSREISEKLSGDFGKTLGRFQENSRENLEKLSEEFLSPSNPFAERGKERPFYD